MPVWFRRFPSAVWCIRPGLISSRRFTMRSCTTWHVNPEEETEKRMVQVKIRSDAIFQQLEGEAVLLNMQTGTFFGLNPVGTRIWELLSQHGDLETVTAKFCEEYDVTEDQFLSHLSEFIDKLRRKGLVEASETSQPNR